MAITEVKPEQPAEEGQAVVGENGVTNPAETRSNHSDSEAVTLTEEAGVAQAMAEEAIPATGDAVELSLNEEEGTNGIHAMPEADSEIETAFDIPADETSPDAEAEKPQGFFRRRVQHHELKKVKAENEKLLGEVATYRDRYLRLAAEMENFRKRTDRDFYTRVQTEAARTILAFLPLLDDLERCINAKNEAHDYETLLSGVRLIQQNFGKILSDQGVAPMAAKDKEFDPNLHEALTEIVSEGKTAGLVLEEHVKGYMLRDKVLRPAKVIVSK